LLNVGISSPFLLEFLRQLFGVFFEELICCCCLCPGLLDSVLSTTLPGTKPCYVAGWTLTTGLVAMFEGRKGCTVYLLGVDTG
jgi:hypothetical protein